VLPTESLSSWVETLPLKNLVIADFDVYWEVMGQLLEQVRNLPRERRSSRSIWLI
jgi:hypothetical protein